MNELHFRAMGCEIVAGGGTVGERAAVERLFADREDIFSRFLPGSELNRVNVAAGRPTLVSALFADTLRIALQAAAETEGLVDPTLGAALASAGYTRDSASLTPDPTPLGPPSGPASIFLAGRIVLVPHGVALDLNGVVKSLAVDDALELLSGPAWVSAGGDVATRGPLSVAIPFGVVELRAGALATSGVTKRRWFRAGRMQHHLIDPRAGRPADSPWVEVTACGATCVAADVVAKAGFLRGHDGPAWLDARDIPGRFVSNERAIVTNRVWDRSMREAPACI